MALLYTWGSKNGWYPYYAVLSIKMSTPYFGMGPCLTRRPSLQGMVNYIFKEEKGVSLDDDTFLLQLRLRF